MSRLPRYAGPARRWHSGTQPALQSIHTFSLRSGEIVRTSEWSAADVLWRTMLRTRLSSRYFGGRPGDGVTDEAGWRAGRVGVADRKSSVARQFGVQYRGNMNFMYVARRFWHSPPQVVHTILSADQGRSCHIIPPGRNYRKPCFVQNIFPNIFQNNVCQHGFRLVDVLNCVPNWVWLAP